MGAKAGGHGLKHSCSPTFLQCSAEQSAALATGLLWARPELSCQKQ
jgi:hypothetical protein